MTIPANPLPQIGVLFVCTQNVFRSMSAQKLLQKHLIEKQDRRFSIGSAGTEASPDSPYRYTLDKLKALGVSSFSHAQSKVSAPLLSRQHVVICMTRAHQEHLKRHFQRESTLFNQLGHGTISDLEDDVESAACYQGADYLQVFVENTVSRIDAGIPNIYLALARLGDRLCHHE